MVWHHQHDNDLAHTEGQQWDHSDFDVPGSAAVVLPRQRLCAPGSCVPAYLDLLQQQPWKVSHDTSEIDDRDQVSGIADDSHAEGVDTVQLHVYHLRRMAAENADLAVGEYIAARFVVQSTSTVSH